MCLIQLLMFNKWETRLFKIPRLETPRFETRTRITVASGLSVCFMLYRYSLIQIKPHNRMFSILNANFHEGVGQDKSAIMHLCF